MRDWENFFRPEDFSRLDKLPKSFPLSWDGVAEIANAILRKEIAKAPVVYSDNARVEWIANACELDTNKARLIMVEEINA